MAGNNGSKHANQVAETANKKRRLRRGAVDRCFIKKGLGEVVVCCIGIAQVVMKKVDLEARSCAYE